MYLYIDVSHLSHVLAHSMPAEQTALGPAAVALGVANMIGTYVRHYEATRVYFCMDAIEPSWRKSVYPEYKAQRQAVKEKDPRQKAISDLADATCGVAPELFELLEVPVFIMPYVEGDDTCAAAVALNSTKPGIIITADKDFWQLITPTIYLLNPAHNYKVLLGSDGRLVKQKANGEEEQINLTPSEHLLHKALVGDPSDNLPGLVGCGEKTATKIIRANTINQYLTDSTGTVKKRKTKTTPATTVHQDARAILKRNLELMTLLRSRVHEKVKTVMARIEAAGLRERRNSATKLTMWLESKGYNNTDVVRHLVATYTDLWLA